MDPEPNAADKELWAVIMGDFMARREDGWKAIAKFRQLHEAQATEALQVQLDWLIEQARREQMTFSDGVDPTPCLMVVDRDGFCTAVDGKTHLEAIQNGMKLLQDCHDVLPHNLTRAAR